jgi:hypothetical protein
MLWKLFAGALCLWLLDCVYILYSNEPTVEMFVDGVMQLFGVAAVLSYGFDLEIIERRYWSTFSKIYAAYIAYRVVRPLWTLWGISTSHDDSATLSLMWMGLGAVLLLIATLGYFQWLAMLRCSRGEAAGRR